METETKLESILKEIHQNKLGIDVYHSLSNWLIEQQKRLEYANAEKAAVLRLIGKLNKDSTIKKILDD